MSRDLQHRIYHYEVPPPVTAWEKIAEELDASHLSDKFPARLYEASTPPPPSAWEAIREKLEESSPSRYPRTLYNIEAAPPAGAWAAIRASLDEEVTQRKKAIPIWRYAAAAVVLVMAALGTMRILNTPGPSSPVDQPVAMQAADSPRIITGPGHTNTPARTENEQDLAAREDAALEQSKLTYASLDASDRIRMKRVSEEYFDGPADPIVLTAEFNPTHAYEDLVCEDINTPGFAIASSPTDISGRYAMLMTPDGHLVRISKKLGEFVCCVSGEEQDENCVDQMKKWRQKLADSPVTPSPGNFLDIVDMLKVLKEGSL